MVPFYKHSPWREAHPRGAAAAPLGAPGTPHASREPPAAAARGCFQGTVVPVPPDVGCRALWCPPTLRLCQGDFGTQSSVFIRNRELKRIAFTRDGEPSFTGGVCKGHRLW